MGMLYPLEATPVSITATGTTAAVVATLPAATGRTTYITGFSITSTATAGLVAPATITGLTNSMTYEQPVGTSPVVGQLTQTFFPALPGSAVNTAIVVTSAAAGTAGVTAVNVWGYQL
jgi:hypothetical protein